MAEYLIQSETLDDIADAIIDKTGTYGKTMTPAEMVTAIGNIPSGGGGSALLASYTASEPVNAARIDFTSNMLGYDLYFIVVSGTPSRAEYLCPAVNAEPSINAYSYALTANTAFKQGFVLSKFNLNLAGYHLVRLYSGVQSEAVAEPLEYFKVAGYYAETLFTNLKIDIYGVKIS